MRDAVKIFRSHTRSLPPIFPPSIPRERSGVTFRAAARELHAEMDFEYLTRLCTFIHFPSNAIQIRILRFDFNVSLFSSRVCSGADGSGAIALLPLAGMITVSLLIVGVGVLMAVVLLVRRKEDPQSRGAGGDDKSKHLGECGGAGATQRRRRAFHTDTFLPLWMRARQVWT